MKRTHLKDSLNLALAGCPDAIHTMKVKHGVLFDDPARVRTKTIQEIVDENNEWLRKHEERLRQHKKQQEDFAKEQAEWARRSFLTIARNVVRVPNDPSKCQKVTVTGLDVNGNEVTETYLSPIPEKGILAWFKRIFRKIGYGRKHR
jgi:predicted metal-dependent hydrolase